MTNLFSSTFHQLQPFSRCSLVVHTLYDTPAENLRYAPATTKWLSAPTFVPGEEPDAIPLFYRESLYNFYFSLTTFYVLLCLVDIVFMCLLYQILRMFVLFATLAKNNSIILVSQRRAQNAGYPPITLNQFY